MNSTFSIIIPTRNRPGQLGTTLKTLFEQLDVVPGVEVIVVNDGGCQVGELPPNLKLLYTDSLGPSAARNRGAAEATGDFLVFLDDDCVPRANWLMELARYASENPFTIFAGLVLPDEDSSLYTQVSEHIVTTCQSMFSDRTEFGFFLRPCNLCVPATVFRELGGFNEQFRVSEDREFSERCLQAELKLTQLSAASVIHCREFNFLGFWKAHFRYGQGAFYFHQWMAKNKRTRVRFYHIEYYVRVFGTKPSFIPLLIVWQLANLAGFLSAWLFRDEA